MNNTELEELFIPYNEALEIKQLGFDGQCFGFYTDSKHYRRFVANSGNNSDVKSMFQEEAKKAPTALTYSQAFKFFRDKYKLSGIPNQGGYSIFEKDDINVFWECIVDEIDETYTKAELECLKKLILIVKQK